MLAGNGAGLRRYIATVRISRDHFLPPDPTAFLAAEPATGRVLVIAPTRAACETIELAMGLHIDTLLAREHGADIRRLAASGRGRGPERRARSDPSPRRAARRRSRSAS